MITISTSLIAPAGRTGAVIGLSGNTYAIDANGFVTITSSGDVTPLLNAGFKQAAPGLASQSLGADGFPVSRLPFSDATNIDGSAVAASATAGKFGYGITLGTSFALVGEAAQSNTKTDNVLFNAAVSSAYNSASGFNITVNAQLLGSGVAGTKTIGLNVYALTASGTMGANICSTSAQAISATAADYTFAIPANTVVPGQRLLIEVTSTIQETGGTNSITAQLNSVRLS